MAQLQQVFDATQWNPEQSGGQLPIGRHKVVIESSEVKANSANTGGFLLLNLTIVDGPNAGMSGPYRLNIYNANDKAREIAHRQLSALCHVIGVYSVKDSVQLHNIPFMVEVGNQRLTQEQEEKAKKGEAVEPFTEVKKVFDINGNEPRKGGQPAAAPAASTDSAAWGAAPAPTATAPAAEAPAPAANPAPAAPAWSAQAPGATAPWVQQ